MNSQFGFSNAGAFLFWFVIITIVVWIILRAWNPVQLQETDRNGQRNGQFNSTLAFFAGLIIAVIIMFFFWCLWRCCGGAFWGPY